MRTLKIKCPYCNNIQRIFYFSYNLKKFFNNFQEKEPSIPTKAITDLNKKIKQFSCKICLKDLVYFFNISTKKYFIDGVHLKYVRDLILITRNGIDSIKNKISELRNIEIGSRNEKLIEYLNIKISKETEKLNHLVQENKDLPLNL